MDRPRTVANENNILPQYIVMDDLFKIIISLATDAIFRRTFSLIILWYISTRVYDIFFNFFVFIQL